jgi:hypothetical protein
MPAARGQSHPGEPRAMLSTVPFLADSALQTATVFTAQGRFGNNAINGDWELGITSSTNKPPRQQIGHIWNGSLDSATGVTTVAGYILQGGRDEVDGFVGGLVKEAAEVPLITIATAKIHRHFPTRTLAQRGNHDATFVSSLLPIVCDVASVAELCFRNRRHRRRE